MVVCGLLTTYSYLLDNLFMEPEMYRKAKETMKAIACVCWAIIRAFDTDSAASELRRSLSHCGATVARVPQRTMFRTMTDR